MLPPGSLLADRDSHGLGDHMDHTGGQSRSGREELDGREVGLVAAGVPGEKCEFCDCRVRADEEVRECRRPGALVSSVVKVGLPRQEGGCSRQGFTAVESRTGSASSRAYTVENRVDTSE